MEIKLENITAYKTMPTLKSIDTDWIKWADFVISKYGTDLGKQIFINTWTKRGSRNANTRPIRLHLKDKYNIEIDDSVWDKIVDIGGGISDTIGKALKVGKVTLIVAGGVVVLAIGFALFNAIKSGKIPSVKGGLKR